MNRFVFFRPKSTLAMKKLYGIIVFLCVFSFQLKAQSETEAVRTLFQDEEILEITLEVDMGLLLKDRSEDPPYQRVDMTYKDLQGTTHEARAKLKVRGNFRRSKENCEFPPLRLNVSKKRAENTLFDGQDKLKIVTHCNDEAYVLREYLVYKLWAMMSDNSFRVRLARITYVDSEGQTKPTTQYAFFLEDEDMMAARLNGRLLDSEKILPDQADEYEITRLYVFEYFIGNLDWDVYIKKNVRLLELEDNLFPVPVPYDFDWCELVDAPYAVYTDSNGEKLAKRQFRKLCHTQEILPDILAEYKRKKEKIYALYNNFSELKKKEVERVIAFMDEFYAILDNPDAVQQVFFNVCK